MKRNEKLRSIYFPFYAFLLLDYRRFLPMLPINLAVTALVLFLVLKCSKAEQPGKTLRAGVLPAFGAGLLADLVGVLFRFLPLLLELLLGALGMQAASDFFGKYLSDLVIYNIYMGQVLPKMVWTVLSILAAGAALFLMNHFWALKKAIPDRKLRRRASLVLAIAAAPWSFLCPFF